MTEILFLILLIRRLTFKDILKWFIYLRTSKVCTESLYLTDSIFNVILIDRFTFLEDLTKFASKTVNIEKGSLLRQLFQKKYQRCLSLFYSFTFHRSRSIDHKDEFIGSSAVIYLSI
jgi:hypothetical protein